jgi:hypothetical protein
MGHYIMINPHFRQREKHWADVAPSVLGNLNFERKGRAAAIQIMVNKTLISR